MHKILTESRSHNFHLPEEGRGAREKNNISYGKHISSYTQFFSHFWQLICICEGMRE